MSLFKRNKSNPQPKIQEPININRQDEKAQEQAKLNAEFDKGFQQGFPYYEEGEKYRKAKEYEKALEQYDIAKSKGYSAPALYRGYVRVYKQLKEYDKAIAFIDEVIAEDKKYNFNSVAFADLVAEKEKILAKLQKENDS